MSAHTARIRAARAPARILLGAAGLCLAGFGLAPRAMAADPPNVIVILADDLGYGDISAYGGRVPTPNIDRIGAEGAVFTQGYVTTPVCSPSRAALVTGRYQQRFGFEYNAREAADVPDVGLVSGERTIADHLKAAGYSTGLVGKWHLGFKDEHYPTNRGFDEFYGHLSGATSYLNVRSRGAISIPTNTEEDARAPASATAEEVYAARLLKGTEPLAPPRRARGSAIVSGAEKTVIEEPRYITDVFGEKSADFIRRHADEPFFLYTAFNAPHSPFQVTQEYYDRFPDVTNELHRVYFGMIAALDDAVGEILAALEETGAADNTIVVFLSDNGCAGYFQTLCSCEPLSGGKLTYYEGGIRVPYLVRWPGTIEPGTVVDVPVSTLDILPTALDAAGSAAPQDLALDGTSLLPLFRDGASFAGHERLVWRNYPTIAVRQGDLKLIKPDQDAPGGYLYDLAADEKEQTDVAASRPEDVAALEAVIRDWQSITVEPGWSRRRPVSYSICGIEPIGFEN
ncbi:MAG: sulfatase-like hydrolase/transferase [Alphaproteobacteria bacterium]|nr:sulfatase-like hydrolase/transferase [Alphaproteobacteria bacterium]